MDKIRLQDLLRFLLPGLLVSLAISFLFSHVVRLLPEGIRCQDLCSFCDSVMSLLAAFLIGHAIQVFGSQFEWRQIPNYRCLAPNLFALGLILEFVKDNPLTSLIPNAGGMIAFLILRVYRKTISRTVSVQN
jgi:hypothetical protein